MRVFAALIRVEEMAQNVVKISSKPQMIRKVPAVPFTNSIRSNLKPPRTTKWIAPIALPQRRATLALIEHLEEIHRRMLYAEMGYASLWEFATGELGLSEGAAQRRIQAMKLVCDVPEAKTSLENGRLSLSNAAKVQSFRQAQKKLGKSCDARKNISQVETLSQKECEKTLFEISPEAVPKECERIVSAREERELKLIVSSGLYDKLQRLKGLLAHTKPGASYSELIEHLADEELLRLEKKKGIMLQAEEAVTAAAAVKLLPPGYRVRLPRPIKKTLWARSKGQCEIVKNGQRCSSRYRLEIDHVEPLALGGSNDLSNLRLACRNHNQYEANEHFRSAPLARPG